MKRLPGLIFVLLMCFISGCAHFQNLPSACDEIAPGDSVLCDLAKEKGLRIEDVGNAFIVVNAIAIGEEVWTKEQAIEVCQNLRDVLDEPITYIMFHVSIMEQVNKYPGLLEVAMSYLAIFNMDVQIYANDRALLIKWLDARIKSLGG